MIRARVLATILLVFCAMPTMAQQPVSAANTVVPTLVNFSGTLTNLSGKPLTGIVGVTFSLYQEQQGGAPLWMETQNVQPSQTGYYTVMLGSTSSQGLPADLFSSGEARWLGVQPQGQAEQPRVMLLSVPYAMKAGDAQTVGGLPASAFVLAAPSNSALGSSSSASANSSSSGSPAAPNTTSDVTTSGGTVGTIAAFSTATNIQSSLLSQTGTTAINVKGTLNLPATGTATASVGKNSQPQTLVTSAFNSSSGAAVAQTFQWQAEPAGNDTSSPSGTLNLLFGSGSSKPSETGFKIGNTGLLSFANGQTFPGTGTITGITTGSGSGLSGGGTSGTLNLSLTDGCATNQVLQWSGSAWACASAGTGTITGVTAGTGLSGGGTSGNVTLNNTGILGITPGTGISLSGSQVPTISNTGILGITPGTGISLSGTQTPTIAINTSVVPLLSASNTFTGNQTVNGNLSSTGVVSGSSFEIGSNLFAFGSYAARNAFLGFAGNVANDVVSNDTAVGWGALASDYTGGNTAIGFEALNSPFYGGGNTASGYEALLLNQGSGNTAMGAASGSTSDGSYISGSNNTLIGYNSILSTGTLNNATAIGNYAEAAESNAVVLGSINGVNNCTPINNCASTFVGIGTTSPAGPLHVNGPYGAPPTGLPAGNEGLLLGTNGDASYKWIQAYDGPLALNPGGNNVGIGTSAPDNLLTVNGSADKPGGGSWGTFSDRRLKTVDGSFRSGLSQIQRINPVRYRYKEDNALGIRDYEEHIGLVAQEVQKVIPEAVTENSKGYLLVNNDPIIWTMLNAIKEQQGEFQREKTELAKALGLIKHQQSLLRAQAAAMQSLQAEVRETRETLRKVKAQVAAAQPTLVATK